MGLSQLQQELTALRNFFNGKKTEIDAAVSAAVAASSNPRRQFFVDAVEGLDTNAGTSAAPFQSLRRALAVTPVGSYTEIYLAQGQIHELTENRELYYCALRLRRWGQGGANPVIRPQVAVVSGANESKYIALHGVNVLLTEVDVVFQDKADAGLDWHTFRALFASFSRFGVGGSSVKMTGLDAAPYTNCKLKLRPGLSLLRSLGGIHDLVLAGVDVRNEAGTGVSTVVFTGGSSGPVTIAAYQITVGSGCKMIDAAVKHADGWPSLISNYTGSNLV